MSQIKEKQCEGKQQYEGIAFSEGVVLVNESTGKEEQSNLDEKDMQARILSLHTYECLHGSIHIDLLPRSESTITLKMEERV